MSVNIAVLGGGAMGTACAILLSEHADQNVTLWAREPECVAEITNSRENRSFLPGIHVPESVKVTSSLSEAVADAEYLVAAIPTKFLRRSLEFFRPELPADCPVVSVVKGVEVGTFLRPSEIILDVLGERGVVSLSGPSHAEEIAKHLPASVVVAGTNLELAHDVQVLFNTDRFRVYANSDLVGVELGAALKNVVAIAAGICDGLGYGDNAKAALMTRGIVEITRFGIDFGANPETFYGMAGVGDLITTCLSRHSRNRAVGERLGKGEKLAEILGSMQAVAEGVNTAESIYALAEQRGIDMPITNEVYEVLFRDKSPEEATEALMSRPLRDE